MTLYIWAFDSTGEAYNACQTSDTILQGDILLIAGERVIGIADTWPIAITKSAGKLHQAKESGCGSYLRENNLDPHLADAILLAVRLRYVLLDEFADNTKIENLSVTRQHLRDAVVLAETLRQQADPDGPTGAIFDEVAHELALSGVTENLADTISEIEDEAAARQINL